VWKCLRQYHQAMATGIPIIRLSRSRFVKTMPSTLASKSMKGQYARKIATTVVMTNIDRKLKRNRYRLGAASMLVVYQPRGEGTKLQSFTPNRALRPAIPLSGSVRRR
jgi:hypothetical protein